MPTRPSFFNNWYKTNIEIGDVDISSQDLFALRKRFWFKKIQLRERNSNETDMVEQSDMDKREVTDIETLDGFRYAFVVTKDRSKMRVYKQIWINHDTCTKEVMDPVHVWNFINITQYTYDDWEGDITISHFPFGKCVYDKFVIADWVKGKAIGEGAWSMKTEIHWNNLISSFESADPMSASAGDYIFIYDWTYAGQVSDITASTWNWVNVLGAWAGMYDVSMPTSETTISGWGSVMDEVITTTWAIEQASNEHKYKIFKDYWFILNFATADGIFHLHHDEGKPSTFEVTYNKYTHSITNDWATEPLKTVSWFNHYESNINFLETGYWMLTAGLFWYNKFMFTSVNSSPIWRDYTHVINFSSYMLLLWPSHTGVFATRYKWEWVIDFAFCELDDKKWYFSADSFESDAGTLIIYTNTKKLYSLSVEYTWLVTSEADLNIGFFFKALRWYQFSEYEWERKQLRVGIDDVSITLADWEFQMCTSPKYDKNLEVVWTQIYQREAGKKFRYKRIVWGMKIRWSKAGVRFWEYVYDWTWDKDDWEDFKTVAGMFFWDLSPFSPKKIDYVKIWIGSASSITKNQTTLSVWLNMDDRYQTFNYSNFGSTAYVQNLMKAKDHWAGVVMFDLPIDIAVEWGNWVGMDCNVKPTLENNIDEFLSFSPQKTTNTNIPWTITIAKCWVLMAPIGILCSSVYAEIITEWNDSLELLGLFISSDYIEMFTTKPDNVLTVRDVTGSGPSKKPLTTWVK